MSMALEKHLSSVASGMSLVLSDFFKNNEFGQVIAYVGEVVTDAFRRAWKWLCSWFKTPNRPVMFIEGVPNVKDELSYKQRVTRSSRRPYSVKHRLRYDDQVITGIACVPVDEDTPCAETEIISGGLNYREVELCLSPITDGEWGCDIKITGTPHRE